MSKILFPLLFLFACIHANATSIDRVEPTFWWVGMQDSKLQLMIYGEDIARADVNVSHPGVTLEKTVKPDSSNYLFVYLDIAKSTKPGHMSLVFTQGGKRHEHRYELKARDTARGAAGFDSSDVLYLIMPDRFANGDPSNDRLGDVNVDRSNPGARHGGDIAGVSKYLNYLEDLGVSTIWFNPILENKMPGGSYHGYAITDFYQVDPRFGSNNDYRELIRSVHKKEMKVVMDMIFNHSGLHHWWMKDLPFNDWIHQPKDYVQTTHFKWTLMDPHAPESEKKTLTEGWFVPNMPDLNQKNVHLATYLIQNTLWWIEYSRIDGIRVDTYPYADYDFMARWSQRVAKEYPDFNVVGEGWYPKGAGSAWWQNNSSLNNRSQTHLETVMDFELTFTMEDAFDAESNTREGQEAGLFKLYEVIAQDFMYPDPENLLVFLDNHDLKRFSRRDEKDLRRYKQALAFLFTTRGIPQLYYGTEILSPRTHADGTDAKRRDFPGGWPGDSRNAFTKKGRTATENEAHAYMKKLLRWRKSNDAVTQGKLVHYTPDDHGVYVYARKYGNDTVLVMLNGRDTEQTLDMKRFHEVIGKHRSGRDVITGKKVSLKKAVTISARGVFILEL